MGNLTEQWRTTDEISDEMRRTVRDIYAAPLGSPEEQAADAKLTALVREWICTYPREKNTSI